MDLVVVDDGSSPPLTKPSLHETHSVTLLRLPVNLGIEQALNFGLSWILNHGYQYVARLDAGDLALPNRFRAQMEFLDLHEDYALVGGQVNFVDDAGNKLFQEMRPTRDIELRRAMHSRCCFTHSAVMMRVVALADVGFYNPAYKAAEDFELFFRLMEKYKVANLDRKVLDYLVDPYGISLRKRRCQIRSRLRVMIRYWDFGLIESYVGLVKSLLLLVVPVRFVRDAKKLLGRRRPRWL